jgi:hypothetical protein
LVTVVHPVGWAPGQLVWVRIPPDTQKILKKIWILKILFLSLQKFFEAITVALESAPCLHLNDHIIYDV